MSQPACLEEEFLPFNQIAGPHTCHSLCHNPPSGGDDELARDLPGTSTKGNNTPTHSPVVSWASTSTPSSTDELFKQFMKAYLKSNQRPSLPPEERKRPLKAKVPNVYYDKLHMDCYHFCQLCEDHFETFWITRPNRTPFATSFLRRNFSIW